MYFNETLKNRVVREMTGWRIYAVRSVRGAAGRFLESRPPRAARSAPPLGAARKTSGWDLKAGENFKKNKNNNKKRKKKTIIIQNEKPSPGPHALATLFLCNAGKTDA